MWDLVFESPLYRPVFLCDPLLRWARLGRIVGALSAAIFSMASARLAASSSVTSLYSHQVQSLFSSGAEPILIRCRAFSHQVQSLFPSGVEPILIRCRAYSAAIFSMASARLAASSSVTSPPSSFCATCLPRMAYSVRFICHAISGRG